MPVTNADEHETPAREAESLIRSFTVREQLLTSIKESESLAHLEDMMLPIKGPTHQGARVLDLSGGHDAVVVNHLRSWGQGP